MVKKDQLRSIALMTRKYVLKVSLKMVAMATSRSLLRFDFIVITPTVPATKQDVIFKQEYLVSFCFVLCN